MDAEMGTLTLTPLQLAAGMGCTEAIRALVNVGASHGSQNNHVHRVLSSPEDLPRRAMRPPERVRYLRRADAAVPILPRASAAVGAAPHRMSGHWRPPSRCKAACICRMHLNRKCRVSC